MTTGRVRYIAAIYKLEFLGMVGLLSMVLFLVFYCATKSDGSAEEDKVGQNPDEFPVNICTPEDCDMKKSLMGNMYSDGVY